MGSAASTKKLKCPKDYEQDKFAKILKLYDRLDSNGDQVIDTLELKDIAKLHIKNRQTELSNLRKIEEQNYNYKIEQARLKNEKEKADLVLNYDRDVEKINNSHIINDVTLENKIKDLENMEEKKQCEMFLNVVSKDGKHIEFWKFFEYMRERTGDIKNINFS
tara:strand:+ start:132 stop:620 length:489 start_codon:yes stop_codon:yes gene_type:complete